MERLAYGYVVYKLFKPQSPRRRRVSVPVMQTCGSVTSVAYSSSSASRSSSRTSIAAAEHGRRSPNCRSSTPQRGQSADAGFLSCPPRNNYLSVSSMSVCHASVPEDEELNDATVLRERAVTSVSQVPGFGRRATLAGDQRGCYSPPPRRKIIPIQQQQATEAECCQETMIVVPTKEQLEQRRASLKLELDTCSPGPSSRRSSKSSDKFKFGGRLVAKPIITSDRASVSSFTSSAEHSRKFSHEEQSVSSGGRGSRSRLNSISSNSGASGRQLSKIPVVERESLEELPEDDNEGSKKPASRWSLKLGRTKSRESRSGQESDAERNESKSPRLSFGRRKGKSRHGSTADDEATPNNEIQEPVVPRASFSKRVFGEKPRQSISSASAKYEVTTDINPVAECASSYHRFNEDDPSHLQNLGSPGRRRSSTIAVSPVNNTEQTSFCRALLDIPEEDPNSSGEKKKWSFRNQVRSFSRSRKPKEQQTPGAAEVTSPTVAAELEKHRKNRILAEQENPERQHDAGTTRTNNMAIPPVEDTLKAVLAMKPIMTGRETTGADHRDPQKSAKRWSIPSLWLFRFRNKEKKEKRRPRHSTSKIDAVQSYTPKYVFESRRTQWLNNYPRQDSRSRLIWGSQESRDSSGCQSARYSISSVPRDQNLVCASEPIPRRNGIWNETSPLGSTSKLNSIGRSRLVDEPPIQEDDSSTSTKRWPSSASITSSQRTGPRRHLSGNSSFDDITPRSSKWSVDSAAKSSGGGYGRTISGGEEEERNRTYSLQAKPAAWRRSGASSDWNAEGCSSLTSSRHSSVSQKQVRGGRLINSEEQIVSSQSSLKQQQQQMSPRSCSKSPLKSPESAEDSSGSLTSVMSRNKANRQSTRSRLIHGSENELSPSRDKRPSRDSSDVEDSGRSSSMSRTMHRPNRSRLLQGERDEAHAKARRQSIDARSDPENRMPKTYTTAKGGIGLRQNSKGHLFPSTGDIPDSTKLCPEDGNEPPTLSSRFSRNSALRSSRSRLIRGSAAQMQDKGGGSDSRISRLGRDGSGRFSPRSGGDARTGGGDCSSKWKKVRENRSRLIKEEKNPGSGRTAAAKEAASAVPNSPCNEVRRIVDQEETGCEHEDGLRVPAPSPVSRRPSTCSLMMESDAERSHSASRRSSVLSATTPGPSRAAIQSRKSSTCSDRAESLSRKKSLERAASTASSNGSARSGMFAERTRKAFNRQSVCRMSRHHKIERKQDYEMPDELGMLLDVGGPKKKKAGPMPVAYSPPVSPRRGPVDDVEPAEVLVTLAYAPVSGYLNVNVVRGRLFPENLRRCEIHATLVFDGVHASQKIGEPISMPAVDPIFNRPFTFALQPKYTTVASLVLQFWGETTESETLDIGALEFGAGGQPTGIWHWAKIQERSGIPFPMWHQLLAPEEFMDD